MDYWKYKRHLLFDKSMLRLIIYVLCCALIPLVFAQGNFTRAEKTWSWKFPRDHGRHAEFQTEWWYFTGNLKTENGRRFGYELTFFRQALAPAVLRRASRWGFREGYVAHFAVTDVENEKFYYDQKTGRGALNLAHADSARLAVHLGGWLAQQENNAPSGKIILRAASGFGRIELSLTPMKPPVFHGDRGLLPHSSLPGDAAYYYSFTALHTTGNLMLAGDSLRVSGSSWMDHEFFTNHPASEVTGWDWFSLHFSDSTEVMLFRFRHAEGSFSPHSAGTFIQRDHISRHLTIRDFELTPQAWWASPLSGGKYPIEWKIKFLDYDLQLRTPVKNQELDARRTTGNFYWEGYVEVSGKKGGQVIRGEGYLEMTGYERKNKK